MTKADFRAMRELVGYSQQALASALGVTQRPIRRWEDETCDSHAPAEAFELLQLALSVQSQMVDYALEIAKTQSKELGKIPKVIHLTYYRDQDSYDRFGRDNGYYGIANANSRAAAAELKRHGYEVEFRYPSEEVTP